MAWSIRDTAEVIEAEEVLKTLADDTETDDVFFRLAVVVTGGEEQARKWLYQRIRARKWRQTEGKSW